jgi:hypothetical protein
MSSLRPAARTTSPDGRDWEIYAYRTREAPSTGRLRRVRRLLAPRSREWTIEAISWAPYETRHRWTVPGEIRGQALATVEGELARGRTPHPRNAKQELL